MSFQRLKEQIATWAPLIFSFTLLIALFVWLGRAGLIFLGVLAGVAGLVHLLHFIERRHPKLYRPLQSFGYMLLLAIAAIIVLGGMLHSCTRGPNDCSSIEWRYEQCD